MRLHDNIIKATAYTLHSIFGESKSKAHVAIQQMLDANPKWGSKDRKLATSCVYDIIRYWRRYLYSIDIDYSESESVEKMIALWFAISNLDMSKAIDPNRPDFASIQRYISPSENAIIESYSTELQHIAMHELGDEIWHREIHAMNQLPNLHLRIQTSKCDKKTILRFLDKLDIPYELHSDYSNLVVIRKRVQISNWSIFKDGLIEIQDAGSQCIAPFLQIKPGMKIIDACAGAGGKSLHIADLVRNMGQIIAFDTEKSKLKELDRRVSKSNFSIIRSEIIDDNTHTSYKEWADRLLLDVPCSGSGVLKRHPDDKYRISQSKLDQLWQTQYHILSTYTSMLKPGGKLVYATCSIFPSENEKQIDRFLNQNPNYTLEDKTYVYPSNSISDGYFMARLNKN